ncbi:MAG TPA: hypothetical protein VLF18_08575 [Tahibacter sp.]|uniref:hypothetical protein n=1 Tax=Tahibacter sp. TaxID=2056211 RepID=UPI002B590CED|nr:hypothetical protein [Tahibacter sp.]HSX60238.1 hypothetical protein [Tahibacter sp.]
MNANTVSTAAPCPHCGDDLVDNIDSYVQNWVPAASAPQCELVADLVVRCCSCDALLNAFVPISQFTVVPHD